MQSPEGPPFLAMSVGGHEGADGAGTPDPWDGSDSHTMRNGGGHGGGSVMQSSQCGMRTALPIMAVLCQELAVVYDGLRLMGGAHGGVKRRTEHEGTQPCGFCLPSEDVIKRMPKSTGLPRNQFLRLVN